MCGYESIGADLCPLLVLWLCLGTLSEPPSVSVSFSVIYIIIYLTFLQQQRRTALIQP